MNNFTPMVIGLPDTKKEQAIIKIYSEICSNASGLLWDLEFYLECPDELVLSVFFDFLKGKNPKEFLYLKFIEYKGLTFPGIAISKIIEFGLVDVPIDKFEMLLKCRIELLDQIQKTEELRFFYPLAKLFDPTQNNRGFAITNQGWGLDGEYLHETKEFDEKLYKHVRTFTASESDNILIEAIQETVNSFNKLIRLGVIKNAKGGWSQGIAQLADAIVFRINDENPLSINPTLNRRHDFRRFFTETTFNPVMGRPEDILQFQEPAPEQFEESPEDLLQTEDQENTQSEENQVALPQSEDPETDKIEENSKKIVQTE